MPLCDIIVVTFNSPEYAVPCVKSILREYDPSLFHLYLVNNGDPEHAQYFPKNTGLTILQQKENLGWEGGLKAGLKYAQSPYVLFMNDDTFVPESSHGWLTNLLNHFVDPLCAAVAPSSNVVMGLQQIFAEMPSPLVMTNFLIGLCLLLRRSDLDVVGGVDDTLPGGDDLDLSIRLRDAGKYLLADRNVFVFHHGFKTGKKVHGSYWNSIEQMEATWNALINKHGLHKFMGLWSGPPWNPDQEGKLIASMISEGTKVLDLGCGGRKTVPWAIGVDMLGRGENVPNVFPSANCIADVNADVTQPLPFEPASQDVLVARHILEHLENVSNTLAQWSRVLKHGGKLILAVPDDRSAHAKADDPSHKHAFTKESLKMLMESQGWETVDLLDPKNNVSLVGVFEKNGLQET